MREFPFARVVGLFVVSAAVVSVIAIVGLGLSHGWLVPKVRLWAIFDGYAYVRAGDPVTLAGFTVGEVHDMSLSPELQIVAQLSVEKEYLSYLRRGTVAIQEPPLLLGPGRVRLQPSDTGPLLEPEDTLETISFEGPIPLTVTAIDVTRNLTAALSNLRDISENLISLTAGLAHPDSSFRRAMRATADLTEAFAGGEGLIAALGTEKQLRTRVDSALISATSLAHELRDFLGQTKDLFATSETLMTEAGLTAHSLSETAALMAAELAPLILELRRTLEKLETTWPVESDGSLHDQEGDW